MPDDRDDNERHEMNPDTIFPAAEPEYSLTGDALHREEIEQGGVGTAPGPKDGMKRYPTESPDEPRRQAPRNPEGRKDSKGHEGS